MKKSAKTLSRLAAILATPEAHAEAAQAWQVFLDSTCKGSPNHQEAQRQVELETRAATFSGGSGGSGGSSGSSKFERKPNGVEAGTASTQA